MWVSDLVLFNANWNLFLLYYGKDWFSYFFHEIMIMMFILHKIMTPSWIVKALDHRNNSLDVDPLRQIINIWFYFSILCA